MRRLKIIISYVIKVIVKHEKCLFTINIVKVGAFFTYLGRQNAKSNRRTTAREYSNSTLVEELIAT